MINHKEASAAMSEIDDIVSRVRQSRIYDIASQIVIMWGVLVFAANIATYNWPSLGDYFWLAVDVVAVAGSFAIGASNGARSGIRRFNGRMLVAFLLFLAFGLFCCKVLGHFTPRQVDAFWPIYSMLFYSIAGLWFGHAFVAIGLGITVLTLIGYFYIGDAFPLWMAFSNGGGLLLGGLWMRRY